MRWRSPPPRSIRRRLRLPATRRAVPRAESGLRAGARYPIPPRPQGEEAVRRRSGEWDRVQSSDGRRTCLPKGTSRPTDQCQCWPPPARDRHPRNGGSKSRADRPRSQIHHQPDMLRHTVLTRDPAASGNCNQRRSAEQKPSTHRPAHGISFPGLRMPFGSSAPLIARRTAMPSGPFSWAIQGR